MAKYTRGTTTTEIYGRKMYNASNDPVVGALVILHNVTTNLQITKTSTDKNGRWSFTVDNTVFASGATVEVRFYGTGLIQKAAPYGDWERLEIPFITLPPSLATMQIDAVGGFFFKYSSGIFNPTTINLIAMTENMGAVTYQWGLNDSPIYGATTSGLTVDGAIDFPGSTSTNKYSCEVSNSGVTLTDNLYLYKLVEGTPGADGFTIINTNPFVALTSASDGSAYAPTSADLQIMLFQGFDQITYPALTVEVALSGITSYTITPATTSVNLTGFPNDTGYADILVKVNSVLIGHSRTSYTKAKQGGTGGPGPGVVFRGLFKTTDTYYSSLTRKDVVKYDDGSGVKYWLCKTNSAIPAGSWIPGNWETFETTFSSVATDVLFAQDVSVGRAIVLGQATDDGGAGGILRTANANAFLSGDGIYISDTAVHPGSLRAGVVSGLSLVKGMYYNGATNDFVVKASNFEVTAAGYMWADAGGFGGSSGTPKVLLDATGIAIKDGAITRVYITDDNALWDSPSDRKTANALTEVLHDVDVTSVSGIANYWLVSGMNPPDTSYMYRISDSHVVSGQCYEIEVEQYADNVDNQAVVTLVNEATLGAAGLKTVTFSMWFRDNSPTNGVSLATYLTVS